MLNGNKEFCQEFLTDVRVPDTDRIGEVDGGWTVGVRWMFHERMLAQLLATVTVPDQAPGSTAEPRPGWSRSRATAGRLDDPAVRDLIGEARTLDLVGQQLNRRVGRLVTSGQMSDQAAAIGRLFHGIANARTSTISFEIAGAIGGAWTDDDGAAAESGVSLPDAADVVHRRRHDRDGPQRHQRARARHAARALARPEPAVPRRPAQRLDPPHLIGN